MNTPFLSLLAAPPHNALKQLMQTLENEHQKIDQWLEEKMAVLPTPLYSSTDLRYSGFKAAPIDTNLFPGGFNNLHEQSHPIAANAFENTLSKISAGDKILLVPENLTRSMGYFENLATLQSLIVSAGYEVRIGSMLPELKEARNFHLDSGKTLTLEPIVKFDQALHLNDFTPDVILLNHDLSEADPSFFTDIKQPVHPNIQMGWSSRTKSQHFDHYTQVATQFANAMQFDPWLITTRHEHCGQLNFMTGEGLQNLHEKVGHMLNQIAYDYQSQHIDQSPFVAVKSNSGTYGMGVIMIKDPDELYALNKKQKKSMSLNKSGKAISSVIIQEGVPTSERWEDLVAEPVIYAIGQKPVGGFYRLHAHKGIADSLNAPGMRFQAFPYSQLKPVNDMTHDHDLSRFHLYHVLSRLTIIASAKEEQVIKQNPCY